MVPQRLRDRKASRKRQIRQSLRRQRSQGFILLTNFKSPKQIIDVDKIFELKDENDTHFMKNYINFLKT